jgi:hypothetical protein
MEVATIEQPRNIYTKYQKYTTTNGEVHSYGPYTQSYPKKGERAGRPKKTNVINTPYINYYKNSSAHEAHDVFDMLSLKYDITYAAYGEVAKAKREAIIKWIRNTDIVNLKDLPWQPASTNSQQ